MTRSPRGRTGTATRSPQTSRRYGHAVFQATLVSIVVFLVATIAPILHDTVFWAEHFPGADVRAILGPLTVLALGAIAAQLAWPRTWESNLLARGLRTLVVAATIQWIIGDLLGSPEIGAYALLPYLFTVPAAAASLTVRTPVRPGLAIAGVVLSIIGAVVLAMAYAHMPSGPLRLATTIPAAAAYAFAAPLVFRHIRKRSRSVSAQDDPANLLSSDGKQAPAGRRYVPTAPRLHPFDLPEHLERPPTGWYPLAVVFALAMFLVFVAAPGLPIPTFVRWAAVAIAAPLATHALIARQGVLHARALAGGPDVHVHRGHVAHIVDDGLEALDDVLGPYLRKGRGQRRLATVLTDVLRPAAPSLQRPHVTAHLAKAPRGRHRLARTQREQNLVELFNAIDRGSYAPHDASKPTPVATATMRPPPATAEVGPRRGREVRT